MRVLWASGYPRYDGSQVPSSPGAASSKLRTHPQATSPTALKRLGFHQKTVLELED